MAGLARPSRLQRLAYLFGLLRRGRRSMQAHVAGGFKRLNHSRHSTATVGLSFVTVVLLRLPTTQWQGAPVAPMLEQHFRQCSPALPDTCIVTPALCGVSGVVIEGSQQHWVLLEHKLQNPGVGGRERRATCKAKQAFSPNSSWLLPGPWLTWLGAPVPACTNTFAMSDACSTKARSAQWS